MVRSCWVCKQSMCSNPNIIFHSLNDFSKKKSSTSSTETAPGTDSEEIVDNSPTEEISERRRQYEEQFETDEDYFAEELNYLKTILHILEVAKKTQKQNVRAEYFSKIEEEDTKDSQQIQRLRDILETIHYTVQVDIRHFLNSYKNQVKDRKKQHDTLQIHDEALQKLLCEQLDKIRQANDDIKRLKQKLSDCQKILGRKKRDLEAECEFFNAAFNTMKKKLIRDRKIDGHKLNILTVIYNDTIQILEELKEKGEQLLHMSAVCRKLETQEEKILPFPVLVMKDVNNPYMEYVKGYIAQLRFFWQRVGQADSSRFSVNEELQFLKTENKILKLKLHKYCQCLKAPSIVSPTSGNSQYVTEGVLEQKKYGMHDCDQFPNNRNSSDESC